MLHEPARTWPHAPDGSAQESFVQALPSSQLTGVAAQVPDPSQASPVVQPSPSLQAWPDGS
jgi:hypothetical protein